MLHLLHCILLFHKNDKPFYVQYYLGTGKNAVICYYPMSGRFKLTLCKQLMILSIYCGWSPAGHRSLPWN